MDPKRKLKLLCLHGYLQNNEVFRSRIGSLRKALKSRAEFEFVEAPYDASPHPLAASASEEGGVEAGGKSWWQWSDTGPDGRPSRATHYSGWELAFDVLVEAIKQHQPDGILGFSQGAAATALLLACLPAAAGRLGGVPPPRFAVVIAGFLPRDPAFAKLVTDARPSTRSLFVYGTNDALVPPDRSIQLVEAFDPSCTTMYEHAGAHLVPTCSGAFKQALAAFLDEVTAAPVAEGAAAGAVAVPATAEVAAALAAPAAEGTAAKAGALPAAAEVAAVEG